MTLYKGKCNCHNITIDFNTQRSADEIIPLKCNCSYCLPKSAIYISDHQGEIKVQIKEQRFLKKEMFGLDTSEYISCSKCNFLIGTITPSDSPFRFMAINLKVLDEANFFGRRGIMRIENGDTYELRLQRKKTHWAVASLSFLNPSGVLNII